MILLPTVSYIDIIVYRYNEAEISPPTYAARKLQRMVMYSLGRRPLSEGIDEWKEFLGEIKKSEKDRYMMLEFVVDNFRSNFLKTQRL